MKLPWLLTNNVGNKNPNFCVFLLTSSCKKRASYTYSHLLMLRSNKTALTYLRPSQQCCRHSSLAQWCNACYHTARSLFNSTCSKIFTTFILTFYSLVFTTPCPRKKGATDFFAVTFTNIDGFS